MNALNTLLPFRLARKGMASPSPTADRLAAIRLQTLDAINEAPSDDDANPAVNSTVKPGAKSAAGSDLSGLIQRRAPRRFDAEAVNNADITDHKSAEAAVITRTAAPQTEPRPAPFFTIVPPAPNQAKTNRTRRQLTVRLESDTSEALDRLAKQSNRTYQDIMSEAIGDYLKR
jgi:hypothetical protein